MTKIGVVSLGCDKNRVDTEKMLARLAEDGCEIVGTEDESDVIIVNTCAFIDSAKEESIDEILNAVAYKKQGKKIVVTGCLAQRYLKDLKEGFPEVDAFLGVADYDSIVDTVKKITKNEKVEAVCGGDKFVAKRLLTTPYHYAYLKIADGCDNRCTYCAIPSIRGKYRSEKIEDLLVEAKKLSDDNVKELVLVAQDVTRYGKDLSSDGKPMLSNLLVELEKLDFERIRLLYLEPDAVSDELIDYIANSKKVCKYADVPFQHAADGVLKRMNRHYTLEQMKDIVTKMRAANMAVRSTFIIGFPGETDADVDTLVDFLKWAKLDYAGFFAYSCEEGTPAAKLVQCDKEDVQRNLKRVKKVQEDVMLKLSRDKIGKTFRVVSDGIDYDKEAFVGRSEYEAPDIDNVIYFKSDSAVEVGNFYDVEITATDGIDLVGRTICK